MAATTITTGRTARLDDLPEFLTPIEAASVLGISKGLVYEMAKRGELKVVRCGRLVRIPRASLQPEP